MFNKIKNRYLKNGFSRNVIVLVGGTAASQAIGILVLPLLTRMYTPSDFEILAVFTALVSIIGVVSCLRFDIAIPIPKSKEDAVGLTCIAIFSSVSIALIILLVLVFVSSVFDESIFGGLKSYIWLLPPVLLFTGLYSAFQYWATRQKRFSDVAKTRIVQASSAAGAQLTFGGLGFAPIGLLLGPFFQVCAGVLSLGRHFAKDAKQELQKLRGTELTKIFSKYDRFPKYSTWEALTNSAGAHLPILIIAAYTIDSDAGFLMLAMKLLSAPISLMGGAVAQVFLSEASNKYQVGELLEFTKRTVIKLLKLGFLPILFIAISSPVIIPLVFGSEWARSGILMCWMAPWFLIQFITSPVSMSLHVSNNQKAAVLLQVFGLFFRSGSVLLSVLFLESMVAEIYAVSGAIFYLIYLFVIFKVLK